MNQYKGQETLRIDSVSYVKVQEKIIFKRANMYDDKYQNKGKMWSILSVKEH